MNLKVGVSRSSSMLKAVGTRCTALIISKPLSLSALPVAVSSCQGELQGQGYFLGLEMYARLGHTGLGTKGNPLTP